MKQLSIRERVLLATLIVASVCALFYYFIFQPQAERILAIRQEIKKQEDDVIALNKQLADTAILEKAIADKMILMEEKTKMYYPEILQDRLILQVDGLSKKSLLNLPTISFTPVKYEEIKLKTTQADPNKNKAYPLQDMAKILLPTPVPTPQGSPKPTDGAASSQPAASPSVTPAPQTPPANNVAAPNQAAICQSISLTMSFKGNYNQMMSFIKEVEALNKATLLTNLTTASVNGDLTGTVNLSFYAVPKLKAQDEEYMSWPYNGSYGKINPFIK